MPQEPGSNVGLLFIGKDSVMKPAIKFRRKVYVGDPRHKDALDKAFMGMSDHAIHRVYNRVADGKERLIFGWANEDGSSFEPEPKFQDAREQMYGFD